MAGEDDQVTVTIEPDLPAGGEEGKQEQQRDANGQFVKTAPIEPLEDIRAQFTEAQADTDRERSLRVAAEQREADARREAARAREDATNARSEAVESQVSTVESGIAAAQAEAEAAEREYAAAFAEGDAVKTAAAQRKIARAEARIGRLDEAKAELETRKAKAPVEERRETPQRPATTSNDPVEAYVQGRSAPTAAWLRAHPDWVTDQKKNVKLTEAHWNAVSNDLAPDSPEYFAHVEKFIGLKPNGAANGNGSGNGQQKPAPRRQSAPVAPGAASGGGTSGGGREVVLSRGEANASTDGTHVWGRHDLAAGRIKDASLIGSPIGHQEMARRKLALTQMGQYDRAYVEQ